MVINFTNINKTGNVTFITPFDIGLINNIEFVLILLFIYILPGTSVCDVVNTL